MNLTKRMLPWNALLIVSMVAMVGAFAYDRIVPQPKFEMKGRAIAEQENRLREQVNALYAEAKTSDRYLGERIWGEQSELIGPASMGKATEIAARLKVRLVSFRPQKAIQEGRLIRYPFVISLEAPYPQAVAFVRELEDPSLKLVVQSVQLSASDGASSTVNGLVSVWALQEGKEVAKPVSRRKTNE